MRFVCRKSAAANLFAASRKIPRNNQRRPTIKKCRMTETPKYGAADRQPGLPHIKTSTAAGRRRLPGTPRSPLSINIAWRRTAPVASFEFRRGGTRARSSRDVMMENGDRGVPGNRRSACRGGRLYMRKAPGWRSAAPYFESQHPAFFYRCADAGIPGNFSRCPQTRLAAADFCRRIAFLSGLAWK